jgi:DNA-binding NarL/FixJ family response regulator
MLQAVVKSGKGSSRKDRVVFLPSHCAITVDVISQVCDSRLRELRKAEPFPKSTLSSSPHRSRLPKPLRVLGFAQTEECDAISLFAVGPYSAACMVGRSRRSYRCLSSLQGVVESSVKINTNMGLFRVLIADDHEVVRRGVRVLLNSISGWQVCGEAVDGQDAIEKTKELRPDVVLMDINMPKVNGLEARGVIRKQFPESEVLVLSQHEPSQMMTQALKAGARGYVSKSNIAHGLIIAIELFAQERHGLEVSSREVRDTESGALRDSSSATGEPQAANIWKSACWRTTMPASDFESWRIRRR